MDLRDEIRGRQGESVKNSNDEEPSIQEFAVDIIPKNIAKDETPIE